MREHNFSILGPYNVCAEVLKKGWRATNGCFNTKNQNDIRTAMFEAVFYSQATIK